MPNPIKVCETLGEFHAMDSTVAVEGRALSLSDLTDS